jgi:putative restriction endonuclease
MKAWVAVTDNEWYRFLRERPDLEEVNFWQPGGTRLFKIIGVGHPFLFKLHAPENFIVGGGFFTHPSLLPSSLAWEAFGEKNGAGSLEEMRRRIEKYRRAPSNPREDYVIGCILLQDPFFFAEGDWIPTPTDFRPTTVQGKSYDLRSPEGKVLWEAVLLRLRRQVTRRAQIPELEGPMFGKPVPVRQRLGQGTFRVMITDTYKRQCAVTREKALPVLEAAHIRPVTQGGKHRIDNGLLLRTDVHALFDRGYVTVTPDYKFRVSRRLKDEFDNGEYYYQFQGAKLWLPSRSEDRPQPEFLEWHSDTLFLG